MRYRNDYYRLLALCNETATNAEAMSFSDQFVRIYRKSLGRRTEKNACERTAKTSVSGRILSAAVLTFPR